MSNHTRITARLALFLTLCVPFLYASAQGTLLDLASPDASLAVSVHGGGPVAQDLSADLRELDWAGAAETFGDLLAALDPDSDLDLPFTGQDDLPDFEGLLVEVCPELEPVIAGIRGPGHSVPRFEALLTVEMALGMPPVTALIRFPEQADAQLRDLEAALADCADDVAPVPGAGAGDQDEALVFRDGPDEVFVLIGDSGLIAAGNDLPTIAASLERERGEAQGSLADSRLFRALEPGGGYSLAVAFRTQALLDQFGGLIAMAAPDGMGARLRNALDTVDGVAWQMRLADDGLLGELALSVDPGRPDPALARLLLCEGCNLALPYLAPSDAVYFSSMPLPIEPLFHYVEDLLSETNSGFGLSRWLAEELGVDIEEDLFDWLGSNAYAVMLEPLGTDLRTLLYQPSGFLVIPVSSEQEAREGVEEWLGALDRLGEQEDEVGTFLPISVRDGEYGGLDYRRVQASANIDVAIALVGGNLVIASPAQAIEAAIDTYNGAPSLIGTERFRNARQEVPSGAYEFSLEDSSASLEGLASLLRLASQPLAFAANVALNEQGVDEPVRQEIAVDPDVDLTGVDPQSLAPGTVEGVLEEDAQGGMGMAVSDVSDFYLLEGITPGEQVTVVMQSDTFDTMLNLLDADGALLDSNDDAPDTSRSELVFVAEAGTEYLVEATSFWGDGTGEYTLTVETEPGDGAPPAAEPQPLAEGTIEAQLTGGVGADSDGMVDGQLSDLYRLEGIEPGQQVTVTMESGPIDTMLYLLDGNRNVLDSNDDSPDTDRSQLRFTVEPGREYLVQATSFWGDDEGDYRLTVEMTDAPSQIAPPDFTALMNLFELPADLVETLAENIGHTTGHSLSSGDVLYTRSFTAFE